MVLALYPGHIYRRMFKECHEFSEKVHTLTMTQAVTVMVG